MPPRGRPRTAVPKPPPQRTYRPRSSSLTGTEYGTITVDYVLLGQTHLSATTALYHCTCTVCGTVTTRSGAYILAQSVAPNLKTGCRPCSTRARPATYDVAAVEKRNARVRAVYASGTAPVTYEDLSILHGVPVEEIKALVPEEKLGKGTMSFRELGRLFGLTHEAARQIVLKGVKGEAK